MPLGSTARPRGATPWAAIAAVIVVGTLAVALWLIVDSARGPQPPFIDPVDATAPARRSTRAEALVLAGSGSNLPVTRALAAAYAAQGATPPVVHTSVGSGGGLRALADGAIDIALISRPLKSSERGDRLHAVPYARAPVVIGVHSSVPDLELDRGGLLAIYDGRRTSWSDGSPIVVLQRERGDSSHGALARTLDGWGDVDERAYQARRWRVIYDDVGMDDAIASTEGSIGLIGSGSLPPNLPIRALRFEGVDPSAAAVESGAYPLYKDLAFVTQGEPDARAAAFLRFVFSAEGREIIAAHGCVPLGTGGAGLGAP